MVTTLRPTNRPSASRITREAIALFKRVEAMLDEGADEQWEEEGGHRREYLDALSELDRELRLRPWETSPVHVDESWDRPDWISPESWGKAMHLRRLLLHACAD